MSPFFRPVGRPSKAASLHGLADRGHPSNPCSDFDAPRVRATSSPLLTHAATVIFQDLAFSAVQTFFALSMQLVQDAIRFAIQLLIMLFRIMDLQARFRT